MRLASGQFLEALVLSSTLVMKISFQEAVRLLKQGDVVAVPTETVYGLAACIAKPGALRKIFKIKGRPADNPLIVHVASFAELRGLAKEIPVGVQRARKFWPGPLTIVLPARADSVPRLVRAGLPSVALRIPAHPLMLKLIRAVGPLAAPSANPSGRPSPTRAAHVLADYGKNFPVLDGGTCRRGVESTVIRFDASGGWCVLREGALSKVRLARAIGVSPQNSLMEKTAHVGKAGHVYTPQSPGQKYRHYAPRAKLVAAAMLGPSSIVGAPREAPARRHRFDAVLGFSDTKTDLPLVSLGRRGSAAANLRVLYTALRSLDERAYRKVWVDLDFPRAGLGATLHERLMKACRR